MTTWETICAATMSNMSLPLTPNLIMVMSSTEWNGTYTAYTEVYSTKWSNSRVSTRWNLYFQRGGDIVLRLDCLELPFKWLSMYAVLLVGFRDKATRMQSVKCATHAFSPLYRPLFIMLPSDIFRAEHVWLQYSKQVLMILALI